MKTSHIESCINIIENQNKESIHIQAKQELNTLRIENTLLKQLLKDVKSLLPENNKLICLIDALKY
jgi:uncharacterized protein YaaW (UPF0174 family)